MNQSCKDEKQVEVQRNACYESVDDAVTNYKRKNQNIAGKCFIKFEMMIWVLGLISILQLLLLLCSVALLVTMASRNPGMSNNLFLNSSLDCSTKGLNNSIVEDVVPIIN